MEDDYIWASKFDWLAIVKTKMTQDHLTEEKKWHRTKVEEAWGFLFYVIIDQPRKDKGRSRTSLIDQEKFNNASSTYTLQQLS